MDKPNPLRAGWSIGVALLRIRSPFPTGTGHSDAGDLDAVLERLHDEGVPALVGLAPQIRAVVDRLGGLDPDDLSVSGALAFWLNLYNAGALLLAARAAENGSPSVLKIPGGFSEAFVAVSGEWLSLDAIEHAKIRRFGDPRIHAALVCGSVSCPTLRSESYRGEDLEDQLDDQIRSFLASGGAVEVGGRLMLSRVMLWYGRDFTRPHKMPTWLPARHDDLVSALRPWLPEPVVAGLAGQPEVGFQEYDWGLACSVK